MKHIFIIICLVISTGNLIAQDTIIKNNGEKKIVKVIEITTSEIKYKKFEFLDGPTYIEAKSGISYIIYSNGTKEQFEQTTPKNNPPPPLPSSKPANDDYYGGAVSNSPASPSVNQIENWGRAFKYQNRTIREGEVIRILMSTKDKQIMGLAEESRKARGMQYIGFAAIPLGIISLVCLSNGLTHYNQATGASYRNPNASSYQAAAAVCFVAAIGCPIASGVFAHKRSDARNRAIVLFNERH